MCDTWVACTNSGTSDSLPWTGSFFWPLEGHVWLWQQLCLLTPGSAQFSKTCLGHSVPDPGQSDPESDVLSSDSAFTGWDQRHHPALCPWDLMLPAWECTWVSPHTFAGSPLASISKIILHVHLPEQEKKQCPSLDGRAEMCCGMQEGEGNLQ